MERYSTRESVLLGYGPQSSFINQNNSSAKSPSGDSDIDFNDVFGGPPRRASTQEMRNGFSEATDSSNLDANETSSVRRKWSGVSEKPVFGDEVGSRRRYLNDDFFDDIFRGNESLSSSPRRHSRDPFCSSPCSRVPSPLPPRAEPFLSSSVPAQFSLPAKLVKGSSDLPTFGSGTRNHQKNKDGALNGFSNYSSSPLSRVPSQTDLVQEVSNVVVPQQATSPEDLSLGSEELQNLSKTDKTEKSSSMKSDSTASGQFHFSIYKWASKGVPLPMPFRRGNNSRRKDKLKLERSASTDGRIAREGMNGGESPMETPQSMESPLHAAMSSKIRSSWMKIDKEKSSVEGASILDRVEPCQVVKEPILTEINSETSVKDNPAKTVFQDSREEPKPESAPDKGLPGRTEEEIQVHRKKASNSETRTLQSLLFDNDSEHGCDESIERNEFKENKSKGNKKSSTVFDVNDLAKKQDEKRNLSMDKEEDKSKVRRDSFGKNRRGGKVQEFVKIFNQESSNKPKSDVNSHNHSSRRQENGKFWRENEARITTNKPNGRMDLPNGNKKHTTEASVKGDESTQSNEEQNPQTRTNKHKPTESSSTLKDSSDSTAESIPHGSEAVVGDIDEYFYGKFMIKELVQYEDMVIQNGDNHEDFHATDAKIRKWSSGKEGNIRSLLSTLHYVLWTGSGWKPVPLVDLIEGNAVKRSYQKALLCLHPDKLQQKGATSNQKHTAEKVFDILQEAWIHFSSLGGL